MHKLKLSIATGGALGFVESLVTLPKVDPTGIGGILLPLVAGAVFVILLKFDLWEIAGQAAASGLALTIFGILWWQLGAFILIFSPMALVGLFVGTFFFGLALTGAGGLIGFALTLKRRR